MSRYRGYHDVIYTVYDNRTGFPVIVDGNSRAASEAMGINIKYFNKTVYDVRKGLNKRWTIFMVRRSDMDLEEED
jgi:hypothetical protein